MSDVAKCFGNTVLAVAHYPKWPVCDAAGESNGHSVPPAGHRKHDASLRWVTIAVVAFAKQTKPKKPKQNKTKKLTFQ